MNQRYHISYLKLYTLWFDTSGDVLGQEYLFLEPCPDRELHTLTFSKASTGVEGTDLYILISQERQLLSEAPDESQKQAFWFMVCTEPISLFVWHGSYKYYNIPRRVSIGMWLIGMDLTENSGSQDPGRSDQLWGGAWRAISNLWNLSLPADLISEKWMQLLSYCDISFAALCCTMWGNTIRWAVKRLAFYYKAASGQLCGLWQMTLFF